MPPAYEGDDDIRNGLTIFIAFDESNLVNNAEWGEEDANTRCGSPPEHWKSAQTNSENESLNTYDIEEEWGPCRFHYYATRDIAAGEEILINYSEFEDVSQKGWADIGL